MELAEFWNQLFLVIHANGSPDSKGAAAFLKTQTSTTLRRVMMEAGRQLAPFDHEPLLSLVAGALLSRIDGDRSERLANLFAILKGRCKRELCERALEELLALDSEEEIGDTTIAVALGSLPPSCSQQTGQVYHSSLVM
jgi:hypothetical protein